jgi:hypothetical protein
MRAELKGRCALSDRYLRPDDLQADVQAAIEAIERRGREEQERAARQLAEILTAPQSGMSRRFEFPMSDEPRLEEAGEQEDTQQ